MAARFNGAVTWVSGTHSTTCRTEVVLPVAGKKYESLYIFIMYLYPVDGWRLYDPE